MATVLRGKALVAALRSRADVRDAEALAAHLGRIRKYRRAGKSLAEAKKLASAGTKQSVRDRNIAARRALRDPGDEAGWKARNEIAVKRGRARGQKRVEDADLTKMSDMSLGVEKRRAEKRAADLRRNIKQVEREPKRMENRELQEKQLAEQAELDPYLKALRAEDKRRQKGAGPAAASAEGKPDFDRIGDPFGEDFGDPESAETGEEREAREYEAKILRDLERDERSNLHTAILDAGGIQTRADLREEYREIPNTFKRKDGMPGDEMADYLKTYYPELGIEDENDLLDFFLRRD